MLKTTCPFIYRHNFLKKYHYVCIDYYIILPTRHKTHFLSLKQHLCCLDMLLDLSYFLANTTLFSYSCAFRRTDIFSQRDILSLVLRVTVISLVSSYLGRDCSVVRCVWAQSFSKPSRKVFLVADSKGSSHVLLLAQFYSISGISFSFGASTHFLTLLRGHLILTVDLRLWTLCSFAFESLFGPLFW